MTSMPHAVHVDTMDRLRPQKLCASCARFALLPYIYMIKKKFSCCPFLRNQLSWMWAMWTFLATHMVAWVHPCDGLLFYISPLPCNIYSQVSCGPRRDMVCYHKIELTPGRINNSWAHRHVVGHPKNDYQPFSIIINSKTVWPSGLRRQTQVLVERSAWVRTPQLSFDILDNKFSKFRFHLFRNIRLWSNIFCKTVEASKA